MVHCQGSAFKGVGGGVVEYWFERFLSSAIGLKLLISSVLGKPPATALPEVQSLFLQGHRRLEKGTEAWQRVWMNMTWM